MHYYNLFMEKPKSGTQNSTPQTNNTTSTSTVSTILPGIDNSQVIASKPNLVKENSSKVQHKEIKLDKS